ncbi:hypothetical protein D3C72_1003730 [compost metagenome]
MIPYAVICKGVMFSLKKKAAKPNAIIGLMFSNIPTVEELIPESAYKLRNNGIIVNTIAMVSMQR